MIPGIDLQDPTIVVLMVTIFLLASFVHGLLGLGFPLVATPLLALMTDVRIAVLLLLLPTMAINLVNIFRGGQWRQSIARYWPLAAYGLAGSVLGSLALVGVSDPAAFKLLLAGVVLLYLYKYQIGLNLQWLNDKPHLAYLVYGLTGGLLAGTVNVMLPALIIFALEMRLAPKTMVQVFNFCFFIGKLAQTAVFAHAGLLDVATLQLSFGVILVSLTALSAGMVLRSRFDAETYRRWLRYMLFVIVFVLLGQYVYGLLF